jgi:hypothetical protein
MVFYWVMTCSFFSSYQRITFWTEDGGYMLLRNICNLLPDHNAWQPKEHDLHNLFSSHIIAEWLNQGGLDAKDV